ncbi:hypothetical protein SG34_012625 [Thalassomonas viridans]|uniref:Uncharacterized protein n=1 Tax=Thalassomonas viridans TaxID=137584 RepID=A0AAE9Z7G8_9GAMM|nr:hypothetical protein [Thalassomonas viridans]WDE07657.1 hypothetical protein SG34_012625 [Thalassomonas viridans]
MKSLYRSCLFFILTFLTLKIYAETSGEVFYDCTNKDTSACLAKAFDKKPSEFCTQGDTTKKLEIDKYSKEHYDSTFDAYQKQLRELDINEATYEQSFNELTEKIKQLQKLAGPSVGIRKEWSDKQLEAAKECGAKLALEPSVTELKETNNGKNAWASQFLLGYMQQSSYEINEDGDAVSKGLQQGGALAQFSFNGRWILKDESIKDTFSTLTNPGLFNVDLGFVFSQSGVCNPDKKPEDDSEPEPKLLSKSNETVNCGNVKFNDVSDSFDVYAKFLWSPTGMKYLRSDNYDSVLSFGPMLGFKSKNVRSENGDSINSYYGVGLEYNLYNQNIMTHGNDNPRARLTLARLKYEEYASPDEDEWRFVIVGHYHPVADNDFVVGFRANLGKGTDDVGVFIGVEKTAEELLSFF